MRLGDADEISLALKRPFWRITLPAPLERAFEAETVVRRNRFLAAWLAFPLANNIFFLALGIATGRLPAPLGLMHAGLCFMLVVTAAVLVAGPPAWLASVLVVGVHVADVAFSAYTGLHAPLVFADRIITNTGFTVLIVNVTSPLRFRDAAIFSVASLVAYGWLLLGPADVLPMVQWDNVVHSGMMAAIALGFLHRRERTSRQSFLLGELDNLRLREMAAMSETDALTALPNRRAFDIALETQWGIARANGELLGLLMIDVDYFKLLNDRSGHAEGDRCLRNVAAVMRAAVRAGTDTIARFGGEEFAVVLQRADRRTALEMAERLRREVEQAGLSHPVHGVVTVSVGSAIMRPAGTEGPPETLLVAADRALYEAKQTGRNRVVMARKVADLPG